MEITSREQLVELMRSNSVPLIAAEIGVAEGIWSCHLLKLGIHKLYLIDVWENVPFIEGCASYDQAWHDTNYQQVLEQTRDFSHRVVILKGFSYKMADRIPDNSLGLAYIDANHAYHGVKSDAECFWPKLVEGGIMAFHDYNDKYGVYAAVQNFAQEKGVKVFELPEDGNEDYRGAYIIKK